MKLHLVAKEKSGKHLSFKVLSSLSIMHIDVLSQAILIAFTATLHKTHRGFLDPDAGKTILLM